MEPEMREFLEKGLVSAARMKAVEGIRPARYDVMGPKNLNAGMRMKDRGLSLSPWISGLYSDRERREGFP
jgi:hypothetical protein